MNHTVEFWLPFPPSTNRLWRSVRGLVILGANYKNWKKRAVESVTILQKVGKQPVLGVHELELYLSMGVGKRGDADNRIKAVLDIAVELMFIVDDKFCRRASVEWATIDHDCLVRLTGEVAYKDQWEFANALGAKKFPHRKISRPLPQSFGLPLRKVPLQVRRQIFDPLLAQKHPAEK